MFRYNWVWLIVFIFCLVGNAHLTYCYRDDTKGRMRTKPFLISLLLVIYLCGTFSINWALILALLTSWIGDVLLMKKVNKWFAAGGVSFGISHICFILSYISNFTEDIRSYMKILAPVALIYLAFAIFVMRFVWEDVPKKMRLAMGFYLIANATMNMFAVGQMLMLMNFGAIVAYAGALSFFLSDCCLYIVRYYRNPSIIFKKHYTVMGLYLMGETLITYGMIMIGQP